MAAPTSSRLIKTTHVFATHDIPLECDVYAASNYPADSVAVLFLHSGGLVGGSRSRVAPWLVQTCHQRQWPLVSASYRLMPQVDARGLLANATAAYEFVRNLNGGPERKVIVAGASAGFSLATILTRHAQPPPLALLSICGISTYQHPFFSSSILLSPKPITDEQARTHYSGPTVVGTTVDERVFDLDMLLPSGGKNPAYVAPPLEPEPEVPEGEIPRGDLYEYWLHRNMWPALMQDVDKGFQGQELAEWPPTVFIQGDADVAVDVDVTLSTAKALGEKATVCMAAGKGHLFEIGFFMEDEDPAMDVVRSAVHALDEAVASATTTSASS